MDRRKAVLDLTPTREAGAIARLVDVKYDGRVLESIADVTDVVVVTREQFDSCRDDLEKASFGMPLGEGSKLSAALINALVCTTPIVDPSWVAACDAAGAYHMPAAAERLDLDVDSAGMARQTSGAFGSSPTGAEPPAIGAANDDISGAFDFAGSPNAGDDGAATAAPAEAAAAQQVPAVSCTAADIAPFNNPDAATLDPQRWRVMQCCELDANKNKYYCIELHRHQDADKAANGEHVIVTRYGRTDDLVSAPLSGRRDMRFFKTRGAAIAAYDALVHQKHTVKRYLDVDLLSCKIGTAQLQRLVAQRRKPGPPVDPFAANDDCEDAVLDVVDKLYTEAERALSKAIIAKVTPNGVETPLGALDVSQAERGLAALTRIEDVLTDASQHPPATTLRALTSEFFSLVPQHLGGRQRATAQANIIDSRDKIIMHREVLQLTIDLIRAAASMPATADREPLVMRRLRYKALGCKIREVRAGCPGWHVVSNFVENPEARVTCSVKRVFSIVRPAEEPARERAASGELDTRVLVHGSRACNWYGILSRGLLLPKQVEKLGVKRTNVGWLGAGLYFADLCCTTTRYALPSTFDHATRYAALAHVQLGKTFETTKIDTTLTEAPPGFHSVKALGSEQGGPNDSAFQDNEYCVYEPDRHNLSYLVEFTTDGALPPPHLNVKHVDPTPPASADSAVTPAAPAEPKTLSGFAARLKPKMPPAFKSFKAPSTAVPAAAPKPVGPGFALAGNATSSAPPTAQPQNMFGASPGFGQNSGNGPFANMPPLSQPTAPFGQPPLFGGQAPGLQPTFGQPQPLGIGLTPTMPTAGQPMVQIPLALLDSMDTQLKALSSQVQSLAEQVRLWRTRAAVEAGAPSAGTTTLIQPIPGVAQQRGAAPFAQPAGWRQSGAKIPAHAMLQPTPARSTKRPSARSRLVQSLHQEQQAPALQGADTWASIDTIPVNCGINSRFAVPLVNTAEENAAILRIDDELRRMFVERRDDAAIAAPSDEARFVSLVDVYGHTSTFGESNSYTFVRSGLTEDEKPLPRILEQHTAFPEKAGVPSVVSKEKFSENWQEFTQGQLEGLDWSNVFVAGGCVLACLMTGLQGEPQATAGFRGADIDLFLYGLSDAEGRAKVKHIIDVVEKARGGKKPIDVVRTPHAVTIVGAYPHRHIQIVLRMYLSPAEVLVGFDVDSCSVGFDGRRAWTTSRARRALNRRLNYVNLSRRSLNYESRLHKYARRGFAVVVPGLRLNEVNLEAVAKNTRKQGLARLLQLDEQERQRAVRAVSTTAPNTTEPQSAYGGFGRHRRIKARSSRAERRAAKKLARERRYDEQGLVKRRNVGRPRYADWGCKARDVAGDDVGDYEHVLLPWGPQWHAWNIKSFLEAKDAAIVFGLDEHRHVALVRQQEVFSGKKTGCRLCEEDTGPCPDEPEADRVRGMIRFVRSNPGRQLMTGSFHPVDDANYEAGVYGGTGLGDTALRRARVHGPGFRPVLTVSQPNAAPVAAIATANRTSAASSGRPKVAKTLDSTVAADLTRPGQELVILVGPPGSGKSSLFKKYFAPKRYVHVNRDTLQTMDACVARAGEALDDGESVVVDNTNPSADARRPFIDAARMRGVPVACIVMQTDVKICKLNNTFRGKHGGAEVPDVAYAQYNKRFEPPTASEGFAFVGKAPFAADLQQQPGGATLEEYRAHLAPHVDFE